MNDKKSRQFFPPLDFALSVIPDQSQYSICFDCCTLHFFQYNEVVCIVRAIENYPIVISITDLIDIILLINNRQTCTYAGSESLAELLVAPLGAAQFTPEIFLIYPTEMFFKTLPFSIHMYLITIGKYNGTLVLYRDKYYIERSIDICLPTSGDVPKDGGRYESYVFGLIRS